ncbi:MAG TPA: hypothetical protein VLV83_05790, partial [Acidobacteriota bacterium]|nr:hypothetical protein [Acidobacteriota bacterium]
MKAEQPPKSFDDPDLAQEYYAAQRSGLDGQPVDVLSKYREAQLHMRSMPRHSLRLGRALPSLKEADLSPRAARRLKAAQVLGRWEELGPGNIGGRTRALLVHPDDDQQLWAAGVSGGVWKSDNGGASWRVQDDFLPNIAVNTLAMDPDNPDIIYAGTGEGYFREIIRGTGLPLRGRGIFKTLDGGDSWSRLESTDNDDFNWVNDLAISVSDPKRIYAGTRTGVWQSRDGGQSWTRSLDPRDPGGNIVAGGCLHLAMRTDQGDADFLYASCGTLFDQASVFRNRDANAGLDWARVLTEPGMGLTSLAIAPSDQRIVYALASSIAPGSYIGGLHAVFRSDQEGTPDTWEPLVRNSDANKLNTLLLTNPLIANQALCAGGQDGFSNLGWYANVIAVDPTDPDVVWAGGVDLFRSDDGGRTWGPVSYWWASPPSSHADNHVIVFHPDYGVDGNQTFWLGGDGGVWRTDNARAPRSTEPDSVCSPANSQVAWTSLSTDYGTIQFYHGSAFPDGETYFAGAQDNGTLISSDQQGSNGWRSILGGDGAYTAVDPQNPDTLYLSFQGLSFSRSDDGGQNVSIGMTNGIFDAPNTFLFITPFLLDPNDPNRLWIGGNRVWRTENRGDLWQGASADFSGPNANVRISAIAVSTLDPNRALVGLENGAIHRQGSALSTISGSPWPSAQPRSGFVTWLAFDPHQEATAYATYAN